MKKLFILLITTVCYSATNDTTIDSATIKRIYMGNYNYNTILASAPILTMRWASDLNRPVFKNRTGTAYKMLADASTSSNTPSTRVFYADVNGAASSSSNLIFDGTKLNITGKLTTSDSINCGNIKSSGRITGTDLSVSDSVIAVSGDYSGRVTGTDFDADDSIKGTHGYFSWGIHTDGDINADGDIYGRTGTYTGLLNTDSATIIKGLKIGTGATGPTPTPYKIDLGNTYSNGETADKCKMYLFNDGSGYYGFGVGSNTDVQYHAKNVNGSHRFYVNDVEKFRVDNNSQNVRTNDAVTFATVNTGNGANELYPMNQDVRTSANVSYLSMTLSDQLKKIFTIGGLTAFPDGGHSRTTSIEFDKSYSSTDSAVGCKIFLLKDSATGDIYGFGVGKNEDIQYHSKKNHDFYINNSKRLIINNTGLSVEGRISTTTLQASDTVKSAYGKYSNDLIVDGIRFPCNYSVPYIYRDSINDNIIIGTRYTSPYIQDAGIIFSGFTNDSTLMTRNDTVKVKKLVASGGNVVTYSQGNLALNVLGFTTSPIAITAKYIKHGNLVTINIDTTISGTSNNSYLYFNPLPDSLRPVKSLFASANTLTINNTASYSPDAFSLSVQTDGTIYIYRYGAVGGGSGWSAVGNKAFQRFCFTYPTN